MKQTVLVCDWSTTRPREFAVASLSLSNGHGTRSVAQLDLCAKHFREALKIFQPRSKPGPKPGEPRKKGYKIDRTKKAARFGKLWADRERHVLSVLEHHKTQWLGSPKIFDGSKIPNHAIWKIMNRLLDRKLIKRESKGPGAKYQLA